MRVGTSSRLAATMMCASLTQFTVGATAPLILDDLGVSRALLGIFISSYYCIAAFSSQIFGFFAARLGGTSGMRIVVVLVILANLVVAIGAGPLWLFFGLLIAGLAVACANPSTNVAIAEMAKPHGMLVAVKQSGFQVAPVVAGTMLVPLASLYGWRSSFIACVAIAVLVLISLLFWSPKRFSLDPFPNEVKRPGKMRIRRLVIYAFAMGIGTANFGAYLALFAYEDLGFTAPTAGLLLAVMGVGAVAGRLGWNAWVDRKNAPASRERFALLAIGIISVVSCGMSIAAIHWASLLIWPAAALAGLSASSWNGVLMLGLIRASDNLKELSRTSGQVQSAFFVGLAVGPPVFGWLVDWGLGYEGAWLWTSAAFMLAAWVISRKQNRLFRI